MARLAVFNSVTLDGYFTDDKGDMSWAHKDPNDTEWNEFVSGNASGGGALLLGRVTYEMMAGFWPTPAAMEMMPAVAEGMNRMTKVVFSRTMKKASWANTSEGVEDKLALKRTKARNFRNGNVVLSYEPQA